MTNAPGADAPGRNLAQGDTLAGHAVTAQSTCAGRPDVPGLRPPCARHSSSRRSLARPRVRARARAAKSLAQSAGRLRESAGGLSHRGRRSVPSAGAGGLGNPLRGECDAELNSVRVTRRRGQPWAQCARLDAPLTPRARWRRQQPASCPPGFAAYPASKMEGNNRPPARLDSPHTPRARPEGNNRAASAPDRPRSPLDADSGKDFR
jgi:hypothetical protein